MGDMRALVHIPDRRSQSVTIYHASLPDFLLDPTRSQSFYLHAPTVYFNLAQHCINRVDKDGSPRYRWPRYAKVFAECIFPSESAFTAELSNFLTKFSIWDSLPVRLELVLDKYVGLICLELLSKLQVGIYLPYFYVLCIQAEETSVYLVGKHPNL